MKVWPIITLGALLYGSTFSDGMGVKRGSHPPARHHTSEFDPDDFIAPNQPHRPVTMAFREVFAKLLNEETDWSAPESRQATAQAEADADDGQDPGKKLFWHSVFPDNPGVPFTGWGDPNAEPDHPNVAPTPCSSCRPELFFTIIDDPVPPKEDENFAVEAQNHMTMGNLPFGELKILNNLVVSGNGTVTVMPCETILVNGVCPLPCKSNDDPLCKDEGNITDPLGGLPVIDPTEPTGPIFTGGGGGGFGGGGVTAGSVPETSTWVMLMFGFSLMGWLYHRKRLY